MSFNNFKPIEEPEPETKCFQISIKRVLEWEYTIRAESEDEAQKIAEDYATPSNAEWNDWDVSSCEVSDRECDND